MTAEIQTVAVADLVLDARFQPRSEVYRPDVIEAMAAEGRARGEASGWCATLYDPIHVWQGSDARLYVLEGFHRSALAQHTGQTTIAAVVHRGIPEEAARELADRSNLKARPMDAIEEADAYRRALEAGKSSDEVARAFGCRTAGHVDRRVTLAFLAPRLREDVQRRMLPIDYAEVIGQAARDGASPAFQSRLAEVARTTKARVDLFRRLVAVMVAEAKQGPARPGQDVGLALFDLEALTDTSVSAATEVLSRAAQSAGIRDGWDEILRTVRAQLRRIDRSGAEAPPALAGLLAEVDRLRSEADRAVAAALGEDVGGVREAKPYLKWVGSKASEAPILLPLIRERMAAGGRYLEPFMGSGAVFFALAPARAVLNDALAELMACHWEVRNDAQAVHADLQTLIARGTHKDAYLEIRGEWNDRQAKGYTGVEVAARTIYLNRTGFNGLYRTNKAGGFNVPWGDRANPAWPTLGELVRAGEVLGGADLRCGDWNEVVREAGPGDVLFVDPPYPGMFDGYAGAASHVDAADVGKALYAAWQRGAGVVCTYPASTANAFEVWCDRVPLDRRTGVAASAGARGRLDQVAWVSRIGGGR